MGASMGMALAMDKGRGEADKDKKIVAVIGDSTFLHMGMQGLLDIVHNKGNVTVLLLDNRAVGMTGGQDNRALAATSTAIRRRRRLRRDGEGASASREEHPRGQPYELPTLFKTVREETKIPEPSVIITNQPLRAGRTTTAQALHRHRRQMHRLRQLSTSAARRST